MKAEDFDRVCNVRARRVKPPPIPSIHQGLAFSGERRLETAEPRKRFPLVRAIESQRNQPLVMSPPILTESSLLLLENFCRADAAMRAQCGGERGGEAAEGVGR